MKKIILAIAALGLGLSANAQNKVYGDNIIRVFPITAFAYGGVGLGLGYERILDKEGKFGVNIPVYFGFNNNDYYNNGNYNSRLNTTYMINPGVKFYPGGQRKVTYGLGASLFALSGSNSYYDWDPNLGGQRLVSNSELRAGIMVNNTLQFNISDKFNIGLEAGIGPSYINRFHNKLSNTTSSEGINVMGNFGFHVGFRF